MPPIATKLSPIRLRLLLIEAAAAGCRHSGAVVPEVQELPLSGTTSEVGAVFNEQFRDPE